MNTKQLLRRHLIERMRTTSDAEVERASREVCYMALQSFDWSNVRTVLAYVPLKNSGEIDPCYLTNSLGAIRIDYVASSKVVDLPEVPYDVIIVPVVGFTTAGYRLGRGGGWYDRLLAAYPESVTIGLAHAWSNVDFMPEPHDMPLTHVYFA